MSVVSRHIATTPKRTSIEAWQVICDLIAAPDFDAYQELSLAGGVAAAIISTESMKETPIVVTGKGPRVRIYCVYGDDAINDQNFNEDALLEKPAQDEWRVYIPCESEDLAWAGEALKSISPKIHVYDKSKVLEIEKASENESLTFDENVFRNKI